MKTKLITIRVTDDFHRQLTAHCKGLMMPVSLFVVQQAAQAMKYVPKQATPRDTAPPPVQQYWDGTKYVSTPKQGEPEEKWADLRPEDYTISDTDFTDEEWQDLQRRAALAPVKPI